jgi:XTP/dITP diphosphohydrolase
MTDLVFATGNLDKWWEAERILGRSLSRMALELPEPQKASSIEVARAKLASAREQIAGPVIVEDSGLELAAFGGFPGPFIKWWELLGGLESICRSLGLDEDRSATAVCALAVFDGEEELVVEGRVQGSIALAPRGTEGFGWDPIFVPAGDSRTFAEMAAAEKDSISHRKRAWEQLRARGAAG